MKGPLVILGPGALGRSAAQWAATCGMEVRLLGRTLAHAEAGIQAVKDRLRAQAGRGRISESDAQLVMSRLRAGTLTGDALAGAGALLEALPEDLSTKCIAWNQLVPLCPPSLLLLSGTSSLPISRLAASSGLEGRLLGFHLFLPLERMPLVELAVPTATAQEWIALARTLADQLEKRVVQVKDQPGFAAARMALAQGLEAMRLLEAGVASAEDLDALMTLGYGHPMGPLELSDRIGLDLRLRIARHLAEAGEDRFEPPPLLERLVREGHRGRSGGKGFYTWTATGGRA